MKGRRQRRVGVTELVASAKTVKRIGDRYQIEFPADYYIALAHAFMDTGDVAHARENFRAAIRVENDNSHAWQDLVSLYYDSGNYAKAMEEVDNALRTIPNDPFLHILKASTLCAIGRFRAGLKEFDHPAIEGTKSRLLQHTRYHNRARAWSRRGNLRRAMADLEKAAALYPEADAYSELALAALHVDRDDVAYKAAKKAVSMDKTQQEAWNTLGILESNKGRFEVALDALTKASRLNPDDPIPLANIAHVAEHAGRFGTVARASRKLASLQPQNNAAYRFWILALWKTGRREEARRIYLRGIRRARNKSDLRRLWQSLQTTGEYSEDHESAK